MNFGRFFLRLLLFSGVIVSLALSYVTSPAQDKAQSAAAPQPVAQAPPPPPANPPATAEPPVQAAAPAPPAAPHLAQAELAQLLAPIALYPDQLLSQILMASTYPLEIVEAARWVHDPANRRLKGEALAAALKDKQWDPCVKALVAFPNVLEMLSTRVEWTEKLGAAVVAQQADVMNEVQQLRQQAVAAGRFKSGPQCRCVVAQKGGYWTVEPQNPAVVYTPVYDAGAIYGAWQYPDYPPYLFPYPVGIAFWPGYYIGYGYGVDIGYYGPLWGWASLDWGGRSIALDSGRFRALGGTSGGAAGGVFTHNAAAPGAVGAARAAAAGAAVTGGRGAIVAGATVTGGRGATAAGATVTGGRGATAAGATTARGAPLGGRAATSGRTAWSGGRYATAGHAAYSGGRGFAPTGHAAYGGGRGFSGAGRFGGMAAHGGFYGGGHGGGFAAHAMIRAGGGGGHGGGGGGMHAIGGGGGGHGGGGGGGGGGKHH